MDQIHRFLNILSIILSVISCIFLLPAISLFRVLRFCIRSIYREKLAGKVVLITGASSGIGEHLAYEYAKHGASLALVARREELLATVAGKAKELGAPEAIVIKADVSKIQDCKRLVDETINHFVDCLINNAGILKIGLFEDEGCINDYTSIMDVNYWGSVNATHFALPHLRKCKGRIVVISSTGGWFNMPGISVYNASKVAQQSFFETLRIEVASDIGITMVTPGVVTTPLASEEVLNEHLAYEYAKHGARLALVARREELLTAVAGKARELGASEAIVIKADVSKVQDCKRFVDETINHFVDCLINNAGIVKIALFEDQQQIADHASIMDVNFWGSVYATHFALPHLKKCKGRIIVIGSTGGWFNMPGLSVYNASKVAQQSFFETLRIELGSTIGMTMVTFGMVTTPIAKDEVVPKGNLWWVPKYSVEDCARAIVNSGRRGDEYLTEPVWMKSVFLWVMLVPEIMNKVKQFCIRSLYPENLEGKVVLITGASSGIGEHLAYEYAKHGANLALVARREELLARVAGKAKKLGAPEAIVIKADVTKLHDCKRFVDVTVNHFVDCLINNAGIAKPGLFEDQRCITDYASTMDVNFWGSVNATHYALPHLRKSTGRIIVVGSTGGWFNTPRISLYNASKVAQQSFFETLRIELAPDIGITMVTLGTVTTPLANDELLTQASIKWVPMYSVEDCAKAIVNSGRRGDEYLTEPSWMRSVCVWVMFFPEIVNSVRRSMLVNGKKPCNNGLI
ncbi:hypothetical protein LXL04_031954 [Taraxacum kok-saghyz]